MTKDQIIKRNIQLSFEHIREIIKNPALLDDITDGSQVIYLEDGQPIPDIKSKEPITYIRVKRQFEVVSS